NAFKGTKLGNAMEAALATDELQHSMQQLRDGEAYLANYIEDYARNLVKYKEGFQAYKNTPSEKQGVAVEDAVARVLNRVKYRQQFENRLSKYDEENSITGRSE